MNKVYLDHNATTPLHPSVKGKIREFLDRYGNPSSMYETGREIKEEIRKARELAAGFFNVNPDQLFFTSGGSESDNLILKSVLFQGYPFKPHIITSAVEHPAILTTANFLAKNGVDVTFADVDKNGLLDPEDVKKLIRKETVLVSVMAANNEVGVMEPVDHISRICRDAGIFFHTDAVQAAGKVKLDLAGLDADAASFSGHKIYAPKGIGILYLKDPSPLFSKKKILNPIPLIHGGHQEKGLRASTENTLGIVALGKAFEVLTNELEQEIKHVKKLRDSFEKKVKENIPDIYINSESVDRLPGTSNINFKFIEGESILLRLDMEGIAVSTGSACSTGSLDPSHVIMAMHRDPEMAHGTIRFSFGRDNTEQDVEYTVEKLKEIVPWLRNISPLKH